MISNSAIGLPNCTRFSVNAAISPRMSFVPAVHPAASVRRPPLSTCTATANPLPTVPSTWSAGTCELLVVQLRLRRAANAELAHRAGDAKARHVRANDERGRPLDALAAPLGRRLRERRDHAGAMAVADPLLAAVEDPVRCRRRSGARVVLMFCASEPMSGSVSA